MLWDQDRTELCVKLWNEGLSASQVAERLGGVTRNAVIGKIHRLGLSCTVTHRKPKSRNASRRRKRRTDFSAAIFVKKIPKVHEAPLPPEPVRPATLFKLQDLEDNQCRFIYGDPKTPDYGYCGCEKAPGSSYCPGHHQVVFQAPAPRTKHADPTLKHWGKRAANRGYTRKEVVF